LGRKERCPVTPDLEREGKELFHKAEAEEEWNEEMDFEPEPDDEGYINAGKLVEHTMDDGTIIKAPAITKDNQLVSLLEKNANEMSFYFEIGFNLLLYGVGSKKDFTKEFVLMKVGTDHLKMVVNGYHPGSNFKMVLNQITSYFNSQIKH
jgi:hypothetical protein